MSIRPGKTRRQAGANLMEHMVVMAIVGILAVVMVNLFTSSSNQMALMLNYSDMSGSSQAAMDTLTRDIRKANRVISCTTNAIQLEDDDAIAVTYTFNPSAGTLTRTKSGFSKVLLRGCEGVTFRMGRRNPGTFGNFPTSSAAECKVVNVSWKCSRYLRGKKQTTENMMTASVVIRRQGT